MFSKTAKLRWKYFSTTQLIWTIVEYCSDIVCIVQNFVFYKVYQIFIDVNKNHLQTTIAVYLRLWERNLFKKRLHRLFLNLKEHLNLVLREFPVASSKDLVPPLVALESTTPRASLFNFGTTNYLLLRIISKRIQRPFFIAWFNYYILTQPAFTCSKLTVKTVEQGVKYVQC